MIIQRVFMGILIFCVGSGIFFGALSVLVEAIVWIVQYTRYITWIDQRDVVR